MLPPYQYKIFEGGAELKIKIFAVVVLWVLSGTALAQQPASSEQRVALTQAAIAFDANGASALEATLRTTALNGAPDAPVTNVRIVIKNVSPAFLTYVSGLATFYDSTGVRCGEGVFKLDALAQNESAETDAPGLRITCAPATWRIVATNLLARSAESTSLTTSSPAATNLVISIDGEEHPIQLDKPMVLSLGEKKRTITVRAAP
jgi:hypothetical protein